MWEPIPYNIRKTPKYIKLKNDLDIACLFMYTASITAILIDNDNIIGGIFGVYIGLILSFYSGQKFALIPED